MATTKTTTTRTNWKTVYSDLPENIAPILREARIKPEQLTAKTDGEILAIEGLSEANLETIRAKYPSTLADTENRTKPVVEEVEATTKPESIRRKHVTSPNQTRLAKIFGKSTYSIESAVETLLKYARKNNTVELHLNTFDTGLRGEIKLPFSSGKSIRVAIFSDQTIVALNQGHMDFDVLLATPQDMPKLAKFAKVLGPKGLMPNPKNGTVTADPEARAVQLSAGATLSYKTEPKFPIIHVRIGKVAQPASEIIANLNTIVREIGVSKIKSAFLTATQTPSLKLSLS